MSGHCPLPSLPEPSDIRGLQLLSVGFCFGVYVIASVIIPSTARVVMAYY